MKLALLNLLACPGCGADPLLLHAVGSVVDDVASPTVPIECRETCAHPAGGDPPCGRCHHEVERGLLTCPACGRWFLIREGIPTLFPDELRQSAELAEVRAWSDLEQSVREQAVQFLEGVLEHAESPEEVQAKRVEIEVRDEGVEEYERLYPDKKFRAELDHYSRLLQPAAGSVLLDLGCGTGRVTKNFLDGRTHVVATDFSFASLRYLRDRVTAEQRSCLSLIQADVCNLPLRAGICDAVLSCGLVCNLPGVEARAGMLAGMRRVLRSGGPLVLSTYNFGLLRRLRGLLGLTTTGKKEGYKADDVYYYNHSANEMREWLSDDFEVVHVRGSDNRVPVLHHLSSRLSAWLDGILDRTPLSLSVFAREMIVKAFRR